MHFDEMCGSCEMGRKFVRRDVHAATVKQQIFYKLEQK